MPHKRLLKKPDHYGVKGNSFDWIRAFLTHRKQQVTVEGATPDSVEVLSGVPKGTVLGPLLFLVVIKELPDCAHPRLGSSQMTAPCTDAIRTKATVTSYMMTQIAWLNGKRNGVAFHPEKCSAVRVTRSRNTISSTYSLKGHTLEMEDYTRYLGVELQSNMFWNRHMDQTVKKANSTLGFLRRNL